MNDKQIARINELARLKKERDLTKDEVKEQQKLRKMFLQNVRSQATTQLNQAGYSKKSKCSCG